MEFRKATEDDIEAVMSLVNRAYHVTETGSTGVAFKSTPRCGHSSAISLHILAGELENGKNNRVIFGMICHLFKGDLFLFVKVKMLTVTKSANLQVQIQGRMQTGNTIHLDWTTQGRWYYCVLRYLDWAENQVRIKKLRK